MTSSTPRPAAGFTLQDRNDLPEIPHGGKYELVEGMLVLSAAPTPRHQLFLGSLLTLFHQVPPELMALHTPIDVVLSDETTLQPDLVVGRRDAIIETGFNGAPVLAIDILSEINRRYDEVAKRRLLEEAECPSYWIIDPGKPPTLTVLELVDGAYVEVAHVSGAESWTATQPFPVTVVPDELVDD